MQLQSQPHWQSVLEDPFDQLPRLQPLPFSFRIIEDRGKQDLVHAFVQVVFIRKFPRELVIAPRGDDKFHFVVPTKRLQVPHLKRLSLAGIWALHIDDLDDVLEDGR